ncbi:hypothetical protein [Galactobacter caseinivorans]|uniref:Uncharacterized protein n=1 Tax=Galactobacter caseinivorans TaxID=2676123 RepID=A0A496PLL0_9MICC|nr:hypothetical protein [Galactobacter caseinivorans]RKW71413.1 hypothetical protein DWQ67_00735 [Galactobacter caseinivorans]
MAARPDRQLLHGTWHIRLTSLPMWRKRRAPTLSYLPMPDGSVLDVVAWKGRRRLRTIVGWDRPSGEGWQWRGAGLVTRFTPSLWSLVVWEEEGQWAVSRFERTPFTPAGTDVIFRDAEPEAAVLEAARAACLEHPATADLAGGLFAPPL